MSRTITLTFTATDDEMANLIGRFTKDGVKMEGFDKQENIQKAIEAGTHAQTVAASVGEDNLSVKVDSRGVPYSAEYHSDTGGFTASGNWRKKRGKDKAEVAAYEDQFLNKSTGVPNVPTEAVVDEVDEPDIPEFLKRSNETPAPTIDTTAVPVVPSMPAMPAMPMPVAATIPTPPPVAPPVTMEEIGSVYQTLVQKLGEPEANATVLAIYADNGITNADVLHTDETLRSTVHAAMVHAAG